MDKMTDPNKTRAVKPMAEILFGDHKGMMRE